MVVTNTVNQDYAGYSDTVTEKLVVIDVSEIIGEAIRSALRRPLLDLILAFQEKSLRGIRQSDLIVNLNVL